MIDLEEIFIKVITNTNKIFEAEAGSIAILDPSTQEIVIQAAVGVGSNDVRNLSLPVGTGVVGWVISNEQPAIIPDVRQDDRFYADVDRQIGFQTRSIMCAPLRVDGHIIGVIELINIDDAHLNDDGLKILTIFAGHAALAIENANLLAETRNWSQQQASLIKSRVEVPSDRALETLLTMVSQQMLDLLKADMCIISRWEKAKNRLRIIQKYIKPDLVERAQTVRSLTFSPLIWALKNKGVSVLELNDKNTPAHGLKWLETLNLHKIFLIPLTYHGEVVGLVEVGSSHETRRFTKNDLRLAETIIAQVAVAIEHARLHDETTRRLAETTVLQEVMTVAASTLDFDEVLNDTIKALHRILGIERLAVFLPVYGDEAYVWAHSATIGFDSIGPDAIPLENSIIGLVIQYQKPKLINDIHETNTDNFAPDTESAMYVPIILDNEVAAILGAESPRLNAFTAIELDLFSAIAAELAIALKNAKLFQIEHQLAQQRQALMDIFADLSLELQPDILFQRIIERAVQVIPHADAGSLIVPQGQVFGYVAAVGLNLKKLQKYTFSRERMIKDLPPIQQVRRLTAKELTEISLKNIQTEDKFDSFQNIGLHKIQCTIQVRLQVGDEILGLLSIDSFFAPSVFNAYDEQTLLLFANQAAIALQNARLFNEIRTAEANYRDLFDNANDFIITLDSNFTITNANNGVLITTGYSFDELLGQHLTRFIPHSQTPSLYKIIKFLMNKPHKSNMFEITVRGSQNQEILLEAMIRIQRKEGASTSIHCIARDVTQRRALEQELQQTEKLSAIGKLVAGVAHELNNPLTTVIGYASLLREMGLPEEYQADLDTIFRHAQRARFIVKDLLTFAQKVKLNALPININDVILSAVSQLKPTLQGHNIQVTSQIDFGIPLIMGDAHQLEQVFINLLTNASQALAPQKSPRQVKITSAVNKNSVILSLADNGPGIPDHVINQVFEPFFSTKKMGHGTGLGLSICFGVIREHKGRIWVENQTNGGAIFYIQLPVANTPTVLSEENNLSELNKLSNKKLNILAVDDETPVLELLQRVLSPMGHLIDQAKDAQSALQKLTKNNYDLIICDIVMPDISGIEFYEIINNEYPYLADSFMFITGNASDLKTKDFLEQSGLPWLAKPFLPAELEKLINQQADILKID
ncbi:GAF domain-containing protein [Anaerolineales bacterium HSG25]|nr:GAF domain-containing protein [Anaerolineales bacterium HSG25]